MVLDMPFERPEEQLAEGDETELGVQASQNTEPLLSNSVWQL